jgi:hypothetical protein
MTNYERYKKELKEFITNSERLAMINGEIKRCSEIHCKMCDFYNLPANTAFGCNARSIFWLNSEYIESPKLTKREKAFLTSLHPQFKYITRNKEGYLTIHQVEPVETGFGNWDSVGIGCEKLSLSPDQNLFAIDFGFITWEDNKPWKISELLKLEVQDVPD